MCDYLPTADRAALERRATVLRTIRDFFDRRGFLEVETPLLSRDTVVDRYLDPFWAADADGPEHITPNTARFFLQTSPEFAMKRLLAAGLEAIYQITRAFRRGESGAWHNPEFTLVEWYRAGDDMAAGIGLLSDLTERLFERGAATVLTYREAFQRYADVDPLGDSNARLLTALHQRGVPLPESFDGDDRDALLDGLLTECVQPHLGIERPVIVCDYPASQAALAVVRREAPAVAERFELFIDGVELANGYHELLDPDVLERRQREANAVRARRGQSPLPETNRLLDAMRGGLPPCAGTALGLDRVLMLLLGAGQIAQVLPFPIDRA